MYAAADIFLFPSCQENCPLAPLQAAASGLPVIFRDIPEYKSLFTLPYLKAATTDEFIGMTKRFKDEDYYNQAVYQSKQLISLFDKEVIKNKFTALYKHLLGSYPEAGPSVHEVSYPPKKRFEYDLTPISNHYDTVEVQQIRRQG